MPTPIEFLVVICATDEPERGHGSDWFVFREGADPQDHGATIDFRDDFADGIPDLITGPGAGGGPRWLDTEMSGHAGDLPYPATHDILSVEMDVLA